MPSKDRIPLSGRTNRQNNSQFTGLNREQLNDPLRVLKPNFIDSSRNPPLKPFLPESSDPTLPSPEISGRRYKRPLSCPKIYLENQKKADLFDKSALTACVNDETKIKVCRSFIERNRDRLWKYDSNYLKKTPRSICKEMISSANFVEDITIKLKKERNFKLSNSENTAACLRYEDNSREIFDPFMSSLSSSRDSQRSRINRLFEPSISNYERKYNRGYRHTPEYGNFSSLNSLLKKNEATSLKR